jgi:hypothetical protein
MSPDMVTYAMDEQEKQQVLIDNKDFRQAISDDINKSNEISQEMAAGPSNFKKVSFADIEGKQKEEIPTIGIDSSSGSNESIDHYLPKPPKTETRSL